MAREFKSNIKHISSIQILVNDCVSKLENAEANWYEWLGDAAMHTIAPENKNGFDRREEVESMFRLGAECQRKGFNLYVAWVSDVACFFRGKTVTHVTRHIKTTCAEHVKDAEEYHAANPPEISREEKIEELLNNMWDHLKDPKGRSEMETGWLEAIEDIQAS